MEVRRREAMARGGTKCEDSDLCSWRVKSSKGARHGETGEGSRDQVAQGVVKDRASHFKDCAVCEDLQSQKKETLLTIIKPGRT